MRESLPPTGRMYRALRNQRRPFGNALAEWVENSFGEKRGDARRVWIRIDGREVSILDDGRGPTRLGDVAQVGAGAGSGGFDTGRFGWGGSIAQLTYASRSEMWALRADGMTAHGSVDWDQVVEEEQHPALDSSWATGRVPAELRMLGHGFLLRMLIHKGKHVSSPATREYLAREFAAALRAGRKIYWVEAGGTSELSPWTPPELSDVVRETFSLGAGLDVELEAGWSDALSPKEQGLEVEFGPRRLYRADGPFEGYRGATIFGWLRLSGGAWLDQFESEKTGIASDVLRTNLESEAKRILGPLMEELKRLQRDTALLAIAGEVADAMNRFTRSRSDGKTEGFGDTSTWVARGGTRQKRDGAPPQRARAGQRRIWIDRDPSLGNLPFWVDAPVDGDWFIRVNDEIGPLKRALEERPPDRPVLHQVLAMAIAFRIVEADTVVRLGVFSQDEFDALVLSLREPDLVPAVYQKLLEAITA